jgi:DNA-directed RNA polymerase specialized sigma24 family protein
MAGTTPRNDRTTIFQQHTLRLSGIAYRILGSRADAEDVLQEAYLRWHQTDIEGVQTPEAWLVTTVTRRCIGRAGACHATARALWSATSLASRSSTSSLPLSTLATRRRCSHSLPRTRLGPRTAAARWWRRAGW